MSADERESRRRPLDVAGVPVRARVRSRAWTRVREWTRLWTGNRWRAWTGTRVWAWTRVRAGVRGLVPAIVVVALGALLALRLWRGPLLAGAPGPGANVPAGASGTGPAPGSRSDRHSRSGPSLTSRPAAGVPGESQPTPTLLPGPGRPDADDADAAARRDRAAFTLASYLEWARYPPSSRPARERPDRLRPHASSPRTLPLSGAREAGDPAGTGESAGTGEPASKGEPANTGERAGTRVVLWQSHVYLAGAERATLSVACRRDGAPVGCAVRSAVAAPETPVAGLQPVAVTFADDGASPDRLGGDGVSTAVLAPGLQGLSGFSGPLRVHVDIESPGAASHAVPERGTATFVLVYTASPPATFTGTVREQLTAGSLDLCVGLAVREPGRYLLDARVDDADGAPFAFLSFDGSLAAGAQEACFRLFGKLVRDEARTPPFTLRDVEGFLLLEDTFPDRRTLPTWEGAAHTTATYTLADFSDATWESETKARHASALRAPDENTY